MKAHVLILNYNGKDLLEECLPSVVSAVKKSSYDCRLSVIDNASSDGSVEYLRSAFPEVSLFALADNTVLCAYNDCVKKLDDDIVIFLNNDIKADAGFIDPLVKTFEKGPDIFMVTPKALEGDGRMNGGVTKARIKWGIFWSASVYPGFEKDIDKEAATFSAGIVAFDRKKFIGLGGYDDLYLPGTVEDSDICFRAWKKGYRCIYQPKSVVYHIGQVSFSRRFGRRGTRIINSRNIFLFMWKNVSDGRMIFSHILFTPLRILYSLLTGRTELCAGFFLALKKMPLALKKRKGLGRDVRLSDKEVFDLFKV